jgi:putative ABC transport system permease protein
VPYADVWAPITTSKSTGYRNDLIGGFQAIAVATSKAAMPGIRDEFNSRVRRIPLPDGYEGMVAPFETKFEYVARLAPFADARDDRSQAPKLVAVLTIVGLLFALLPALNLVNINVSRMLERASEIGVRKAFGARSRTLIVQFIVENVLLTLAGAIIAFGISMVLLDAINRTSPLPNLHLALNVRVFLWGVGLALAFGILSGAYPAWRMSRLRPVEALKGVTR